jgi:ribosomal protein S18 acetylase RimI-like enzyme
MTEAASARIRAATEADSEAIGRVHVAAWRETYRGLIPDHVLAALSPEQRAEQWRSGLARGAKGPSVFVAEDSNESIVGFGAAGPPRDTTLGWQAEIHALYLLRANQRRRLGTQIMQHLAAALLLRGRRSVGLWVLTTNAPARAFYERFGGRVADNRTDHSDGWSCAETAYLWNDLPRAARDRS